MENTKEIVAVKTFARVIQIYFHLAELSHQISSIYFELLKNTNVVVKTFISDTTRSFML